jgi:hypothetical protein
MQFIGTFGPDASAAALGQILEIAAADGHWLADLFVHHEQTFERFARGLAVDGFVDGDPYVSAGFYVDCHDAISRIRAAKYSNAAEGGKGEGDDSGYRDRRWHRRLYKIAADFAVKRIALDRRSARFANEPLDVFHV